MKKFLLLLLLLLIPCQSWAAFTHYYTFPVNGSGEVPSTQSNYPVRLILPAADGIWCTVANGGHVANSSGFDLRPYADSGHVTAFTYYLVPGTYIGTSSCTFEMWVNVTSLTNSTTIYLFYGDAALNTDGSSTSTWDTNYTGVWHLANGTTLSTVDSSTYTHTGTNSGATATTGQIDGAAAFVTGSSQNIILPNADQVGTLTTYTVSFWFKTSNTADPGNFYGEGSTGGSTPLVRVNINDIGAGVINFYHRGDGGVGASLSSGSGYSDNAWHYVVMIRRAAVDFELFVDNTSVATDTTNNPGTTSLNTARVGAIERTSITQYLTGSLDEIQRSKINRSNDWNTIGYRNNRPSSTFFSSGSETAVGGGGGGTVIRNLMLLGCCDLGMSRN